MDPVERLRDALERLPRQTDRAHAGPGYLTYGDLRAILLRLDVAETTGIPWCWEHACETPVCLPRHVIDDGTPLPAPFGQAAAGVHCASCDGHSCPDVG